LTEKKRETERESSSVGRRKRKESDEDVWSIIQAAHLDGSPWQRSQVIQQRDAGALRKRHIKFRHTSQASDTQATQSVRQKRDVFFGLQGELLGEC
jgi:hypothetical protein